MTNTGLKRIFKYMFGFAERMLLLFVGFTILWCLYMGIVGNNFDFTGPNSMLSNLPLYFLLLGGLLMLIISMGYVPLLSTGQISMGATRKEFSYGVAFAFLILSLEISIIGTIVYLIMGALQITNPFYELAFGTAFSYWLICFGALLFVAGLGIMLALLILKFGRVAYYIFVAVIAVLGGMIGGFSVALTYKDGFSISVFNYLGVIMLCAGIVLYVIGCVVYKNCTKKLAITV